MTAPDSATRQQYQAWVEDQIDEFKSGLTRDELLDLAEEAVNTLLPSADGQYPLTEILLSDAVDTLLLARLQLPGYRAWRRSCQIDTRKRPRRGTVRPARAAG